MRSLKFRLITFRYQVPCDDRPASTDHIPVSVTESTSGGAEALSRKSTHVVLALLLVLLGIGRLSLIDRGRFYWADERCYLPAIQFVEAIGGGNWREAAGHLFSAPGPVPPARPGFVLVSMIPAITQKIITQKIITPLLGLPPNSPNAFWIAAAFNVPVTLGITLCVFGLFRAWFREDAYALLAAFVYSLLANANVWVRHLVPYELSLLLFLSSLWLITTASAKDRPRVIRFAFAGLVTAWGYTCYPGHYAFVLINTVAAIAAGTRPRRPPTAPDEQLIPNSGGTIGHSRNSNADAQLRRRFLNRFGGARYHQIVAFGSLAAFTMTLLEAVSRFAGRSYFRDLAALSGSVTMGDPGEGLRFVWRYLRDVEGPIGIALLPLFGAFMLRMLFRKDRRLPAAAAAAITMAIVGCLLHSAMGVFWGRMVWYGRVLAVYLPFLVIGSVALLAGIKHRGVRQVATGMLLVLSVTSFFRFALPYQRLTYPAEFLQANMSAAGRNLAYPANILWGYIDGDFGGTVEAFDPALINVTDTRPDGLQSYVWLASHADARLRNAEYIAVNFKFTGYVRANRTPFEPPPGYELLAESPHPDNFAAHGYEGRKPWERTRLRTDPLTLRIYRPAVDR
jgi:hypothetical protein